jgi:hypothetical protein
MRHLSFEDLEALLAYLLVVKDGYSYRQAADFVEYGVYWVDGKWYRPDYDPDGKPRLIPVKDVRELPMRSLPPSPLARRRTTKELEAMAGPISPREASQARERRGRRLVYLACNNFALLLPPDRRRVRRNSEPFLRPDDLEAREEV